MKSIKTLAAIALLSTLSTGVFAAGNGADGWHKLQDSMQQANQQDTTQQARQAAVQQAQTQSAPDERATAEAYTGKAFEGNPSSYNIR